MLATIYSAAIYGVEAYLVDIEVDLSYGLPGMVLVGLPDTAVQEARERVRSAIRNSGLNFPPLKITVNLAPASTRKTGPNFDLAVALGILSASEQLPCAAIHEWVIAGELSLNGTLRPVQGALALALAARQAGKKYILLSAESAPEAALVPDLQVYPAHSLQEALAILQNPEHFSALKPAEPCLFQSSPETALDFAEVKGHAFVKRGLEIAAAGGHNLLMVGPPGSGKTMLAKRFVSILPFLSLNESLEVSKIHSICGQFRQKKRRGLLRERPFRAPHHSITIAGLVGGSSIPRPGEISLADHGVLFLDELLEFRREVLEVLRQPLEEGQVTLARAGHSVTYPSRFCFLAAMNPCPCGYQGDALQFCVCTPGQIERYWSRLSGPLLDRIDLHLSVPRLNKQELVQERLSEPSVDIRQRVIQARELQRERFSAHAYQTNAEILPRDLQHYCRLDSDSRTFLQAAVQKLDLSARAYERILKVARTLADLEAREQIALSDLAEAIQFRCLDRRQRSLVSRV
ncbi:hypothetical protein COW36_24060 [bacterium (Candidatus Blackallbacteria) CG17_big_fil_post_rev_8_21_14_2_50_48_46]|uniref:MCM C-terminal AAA(+) ATPase domain-containing protein n=1 Tax=bacterium (Candidatus Blackallbacteria) CG17_big_fil_post_rev_8_21_14_2_50_48_46 TaxID=2014261 RepID=A0A2M7FYA2_9BACT|nr:MAG: hypothetical protein COW64_19000 [bacterium (Candidatus Blackallbacteria) CG18_big_fil_WC_8_21_14_2_50_49_26]PIW13746.1 MAG: hypothetical protein COW36_24060 [bacterium (Candidatus Blackallbacteria) CG17_big_fil_post_rev_8_21_14_2_50_48_46]PIW44972.1 MAG: hypothetical protein COW20_21690 [bacterium (Candidatus Blackallbacteria) CG13_big_fil_rev_8_21_14_2_50_49_14]